MPRLNGFQAAAQIRKLLPDATLVAYTGWQKKALSDEDGDRALFDHYALKPADVNELLAFMVAAHSSRRKKPEATH